MNSELYKRIISSLFLICLVFLSAFINNYIFLSMLFIVLILSWVEWIKIIEKISIKKAYRIIHIIFFFHIPFISIYHLF